MNNFQYYNPVRIIFGKDRIGLLKDLIDPKKKILLTYGGGSIKKNGVYDQVKAALSGHAVIEFGGIEPNPHFDTLMKAVEIVKKENIDFLLAVGGGSVLDGTKFISAASFFEGDPWDICDKGAKLKKALPIGTVLTIPATGSEMNSGGVVTNILTKQKRAFGSPLVFPQFSILDASVTRSLPKIQRANGVADAFVHVMEQYMTYSINAPLQDRFSEAILLTLIEEGRQYVEEPDNMNTAENVVWCSTLALNGLIGYGVPQDWSTHMIGHELTAAFGIDHGQTLALILPGILHIMKEEKKEKLLQYADRIWNIREGSKNERIENAIQKTEDFFYSLGLGVRLSDYKIPKESIDYIALHLEEQGMSALRERGLVTPEKVKAILLDRI